jgi:hypothetical protein
VGGKKNETTGDPGHLRVMPKALLPKRTIEEVPERTTYMRSGDGDLRLFPNQLTGMQGMIECAHVRESIVATRPYSFLGSQIAVIREGGSTAAGAACRSRCEEYSTGTVPVHLDGRNRKILRPDDRRKVSIGPRRLQASSSRPS